MSETTKTWYEVVDRFGTDYGDYDNTETLDEARGMVSENARDWPSFAPFRIIRVTETREEVT